MRLTLLTLGLACLSATPLSAARPNVLFIAVDDLKTMLGCYGDTTIKSPNIDRLAASGVLFKFAYANQAVCAPSRNTLLTGLRPTTIGIYDLKTFFRNAVPDAVTLPQYFMQHGWRTEALGKVLHTDHGNQEDPASWSVPHWRPDVPNFVLPESLAHPGPNGRGPSTEAADVPDNTYLDGQLADEAVRRLQAAKDNPDQPFFLAVGFIRPHLPFVAPKRYWDLYDPASFKLAPYQEMPVDAPDYAGTSWGELRLYSDIPQKGPIPPDQQRHLIHAYHAAVSYSDAQIGRVLDELDRLGLRDNTIVVLWGDHGWHLGDHGFWCKHTNYEEAAHLPLIVRAPGVTPVGAKTDTLVETVDLYPTLCQLAGLPVPAGLDGATIVPTLEHPDTMPTKEAIFHAYPRWRKAERATRMGRAVRTARYRLVEWKIPGQPADTADLELYDYHEDPEETRNLAAEKPDVVARLRAILATQPEAKPQWRASTSSSDASDE